MTEALGPPDPIIMGKTNVIIGENGGGAGGGGGLAGLLAAAAAAAAALLSMAAGVLAFVMEVDKAVVAAARRLAQNILNAVKQGVDSFAEGIMDFVHGRRSVMTSFQEKRERNKFNELSNSDANKFDALLANANSRRERQYLRKALAAGRPISEISPFADKIRNKNDKWLDDNLRLTGDSNGRGVQQQWSHSCNATMVEAVRGEVDPVYSLDKREANPNFDDVASGNPDLAADQKGMLESNYVGPAAGSHSGVAVPRSAAGGGGRWADDLLNNNSDSTGATYTTLKDPTTDQAISSIDDGIDDGVPVPIVIGNSNGAYTHYVLVTDRSEGPPKTYTIHDPWDGTTVTRSESDIKNGSLNIAGSNQVTAVEVPTVEDP